MAKYQIKHTCGHDFEHDIFGTNVNGERDKRVEWLSTTLCTECYRQEQLDVARKNNTGLPALIGSEKQINWAETIRANKITAMNELQKKVGSAAYAEKLSESLDAIINNNSAKFWIDNRFEAYDVVWLRIWAKETL